MSGSTFFTKFLPTFLETWFLGYTPPPPFFLSEITSDFSRNLIWGENGPRFFFCVCVRAKLLSTFLETRCVGETFMAAKRRCYLCYKDLVGRNPKLKTKLYLWSLLTSGLRLKWSRLCALDARGLYLVLKTRKIFLVLCLRLLLPTERRHTKVSIND